MSVAIPSSRYFPLRAGIAVALLALGSLANAQTTLSGKVSTRPLTRDDISAYKLPSTLQTTGGLMTIGIGQPAYLEALIANPTKTDDIASVAWSITRKPSASQAKFEDSPLPSAVPAYEPSDRSNFIVAGRTFLRPDVAGSYFLKATVTTKAGPKLVLPFMITAGTYVGGQTCDTCHSGGGHSPWNMGTTFAKTAHPHLFQQGVDGKASDHYGQNCISCHVVGFDANPAAKNNGFDDRAAAAGGWTVPAVANQKPGTFDALPKELKELGGIQCENCHGPGSQHVQGGNPLQISISYDSGVCAQCHAALKNHSKSGQFLTSTHANAVVETEAGCAGCHTGTGFMDRMNGVAITGEVEYSAINCQACHEPHGQTSPDNTAHLIRSLNTVKLVNGVEIKDGGAGMLCMNCHMSRRNATTYAETTAGSNRFGPHHGPQSDMLAGTNAYTYGKTIASSPHLSKVEDTCAGCHMQMTESSDPMLTQVGGHTFRISAKAADGTKKSMTGACKTCHTSIGDSFDLATQDYDGDGKVEPVQTEVQHLLDQLALLLPEVGQAKTSLTITSSWTRPQLKAAYNYLFVQEDKSLGVHNTQYAVGLLKASIDDLKAQK